MDGITGYSCRQYPGNRQVKNGSKALAATSGDIGHIKISSEPGEGTTVKVYVPRSVAADERLQSPAPVAERPERPDGKPEELIPVVEDEERVRTPTAASLTELGYSDIDADSAATAFALLEKHDDVALLSTDIVMPEVNGRRLAELAAERRPGIKVLFTTGFMRNAVMHSGVNFLPKPFTLDQLALKVRSVLDGKGLRARPAPPR